MFYPFFEISCGEVEYLSQILYKWHTFAGQNADDLPHWARKQLNGEINAAARYSCLRDASAETYDGCYSRRATSRRFFKKGDRASRSIFEIEEKRETSVRFWVSWLSCQG